MASYTAIPSKEPRDEASSHPFDSKSELRSAPDPLVVRPGVMRWWPWCLHLFIFVSSISAGLLVRSGSRCSPPKEALVGEHAWDLTVRFDGSLSRKSSPFKGPLSAKVHQLWEDLVPQNMMVVPEDEFQTLNASKHSVKAPAYLGNGRLAAFEGFHYIHCLHSLWKTHYPEYYTANAKFAEENREEWLEHVDHCTDILRQKLMCDADPGLITYNWLKGHYDPHPNFNVQHKCRDYNKLLDAAARYGTIPVEGVQRAEVEQVVDFVGEPPFDPTAEG